MKKSELKKIIKEELKSLKENNNDGSQYHIEQIDDDLMYGELNK